MEFTLATILALVLLVHRLGHFGGYRMLGTKGMLANFLGSDTVRIVGSLIWLVGIVGFAGAGLAVLGIIGGSLAIWRIITATCAVISLVVIALFWPGSTWNVPAAAFGDAIAFAAIAYVPLWV